MNKTCGMVDVSHKKITQRLAIASATVKMSQEAFKAFCARKSPKGNVLETARIAGIMAAKGTAKMIPMCHPLKISKANISFRIEKKKNQIIVNSEIGYRGRTGVEMEALTAVSIAALTIYDMMKWVDKTMTISAIKLLKKTGGKSGLYTRK